MAAVLLEPVRSSAGVYITDDFIVKLVHHHFNEALVMKYEHFRLHAHLNYKQFGIDNV